MNIVWIFGLFYLISIHDYIGKIPKTCQMFETCPDMFQGVMPEQMHRYSEIFRNTCQIDRGYALQF